MQSLSHAAVNGNADLFAWAEARHRRPEPTQTYPARWVARRCPGLSPATARLVAEIHFGMEAR